MIPQVKKKMIKKRLFISDMNSLSEFTSLYADNLKEWCSDEDGPIIFFIIFIGQPIYEISMFF